ncbi:MAG: hypothetical protein E7316_01575 [Clostridiales bacterium]|nr:hypothetical protein [Clostridiales bacterium]
MNREEILALSQKENKNKPDERSRAIQTKAKSISQIVGLALCVILGPVGIAIKRDSAFLWCALAIYWGMVAAERLAYAAREKTKWQWVGAGAITVCAMGSMVIYILALLGIW